MNAGVAGAIGVIWSSNVAPRTVWSIGTAPMPSVTGLPATPVTVAVGLSFWTSDAVPVDVQVVCTKAVVPAAWSRMSWPDISSRPPPSRNAASSDSYGVIGAG